MRTGLTMTLVALTVLTAVFASAETASPMLTHDPLMNQIMRKQLMHPSGGVTGAVRIGSGEAITLSLVDPLAPLKPAAGLVPAAPIKTKAGRKTRRAGVQLRKMSDDERRADWSGRK